MNIGLPELIVIFVVALLVFGPKKLPELGRTLGKGLQEFKRASNDLRRTLDEEIRVEEQRARPAPPTPTIAPPAELPDPASLDPAHEPVARGQHGS